MVTTISCNKDFYLLDKVRYSIHITKSNNKDFARSVTSGLASPGTIPLLVTVHFQEFVLRVYGTWPTKGYWTGEAGVEHDPGDFAKDHSGHLSSDSS